MKAQTMSIVVGGTACNASCPFCVSKQTEKSHPVKDVNWRNFDKACRLAEIAGCTTVLLTGKGEPTLYPEEICCFLNGLGRYNFPLLELQTNGIELQKPNFTDEEEGWLMQWMDFSLNTICLSAVHYHPAKNREIYGNDYPEIDKLVNMLHQYGYTVRLSIMAMQGYIETTGDIRALAAFCRHNQIEQLTVRPIYGDPTSGDAGKWASQHTLTPESWSGIRAYFDNEGSRVLELAHGATVYDFEGQNLCLSNCLTTNTNADDIRQLIYYPDGTISCDWRYTGARIL